MTTSHPACILNRVLRDKLPRVLAHILDKLAATDDGEVFSAAEKQQLCEMLAFSDLQVDEMVALAQQIFTDAAHFEKVDRFALLNRYDVDADVVAIVEKAWRKKGKPAAKQIAAKYPLDTTSSILILTKSNWRLHLEMGQSKLRGATDPTAIFQLKLQDPSGATQQHEEMLDLEMNHDELRGFFQQLNAIQAQIDRDSSAAQANAA